MQYDKIFHWSGDAGKPPSISVSRQISIIFIQLQTNRQQVVAILIRDSARAPLALRVVHSDKKIQFLLRYDRKKCAAP